MIGAVKDFVDKLGAVERVRRRYREVAKRYEIDRSPRSVEERRAADALIAGIIVEENDQAYWERRGRIMLSAAGVARDEERLAWTVEQLQSCAAAIVDGKHRAGIAALRFREEYYADER